MATSHHSSGHQKQQSILTNLLDELALPHPLPDNLTTTVCLAYWSLNVQFTGRQLTMLLLLRNADQG